MKNLDSFLHPERKPNIRFKLSSFADEFEMRVLSAEEDRKVLRSLGDKRDATDALIAYAAEALVVPDLRDAEFQNALAENVGHPIMNPADALIAMTTSAELAQIISVYTDYSGVDVSFRDEVEEVKN